MPEPADAALLATLARGLVETAARAWRAGDPPEPYGVGLLRMAAWQAGRSGLEGELLHPATMRPASGPDVLRALLAHVRDALEDSGDLAAAEEGIDQVLKRGTGARIQRDALARTGSLRDAVAECVTRTRG